MTIMYHRSIITLAAIAVLGSLIFISTNNRPFSLLHEESSHRKLTWEGVSLLKFKDPKSSSLRDGAVTTIPEGLRGREVEMTEENLNAALAAISVSLDDVTMYPNSIVPYHLEDVVQSSTMFANSFFILIYDPPTDAFLFLVPHKHNGKRRKLLASDENLAHRWVRNSQLVSSAENLAFMLRQTFPAQFQGRGSPELAFGITAGDYPHISDDCVSNFPDVSENCQQQNAPILQFGSTFKHFIIAPNMIAMPMPEAHHLHCFKHWSGNAGEVCPTLQAAGREGLPGALVFGEEFGLSWENLIPQVVWRGADFGYLGHGHHTVRSTSKELVNKVSTWERLGRIPHGRNKPRAAAYAMSQAYENLIPRWQGVFWTAEAEFDAQYTSSTLPWADIKFTPFPSHPEEILKLEEYGINAVGQRIELEELAKYKYHLDIGGGGGTTWSGTIQKLAMPGLLFHHLTPTKDYIHDYMKPWRHYIPVASDLRDLKQKYKWAESHPQAAKLIASNASALMRHLGTPEGFGKMFQEVFVEPVQRIIEAYSVSDHPGRPWREVIKEMEGQYGILTPVLRCTGASITSCEKIGTGDQ
mmetsp:Transcript_18019/g.32746  ORF Transcript_18019/g.32746 Transcript_18019/m.32746 type:complete len:583 (+) Transcript_18019:50-1798(+)